MTDGDAVTKLVDYYRRAAVRMQGMPMYNAALEVEGVGFREHDGRQVGVIVTPWFMNVAMLPAERDRDTWRVGKVTRVEFPSGLYDFVVNEAGDNGLIATCSLFSLMHEFSDQPSAQTAAKAAADALFEPEAPPAPKEPRTFSRRKLFGG